MTEIMPLEGVQAVVAWHNVVGVNGVLCAASPELEVKVGEHYAARAVDHIPPNTHLQRLILTKTPDALREQVHYRGQVSNLQFEPIADLHELVARGIQKAIFLPYINLVPREFPDELEILQYGLPYAVTRALKDKGGFQQWLMAHGFEQHTLNHVVCHVEAVAERGRGMIRQIESMLQDADMVGEYPAGLIIRSVQSDGNYGMASIQQVLDDHVEGGVQLKRGEIVLRRNGNSHSISAYENWEDALQAVHEHILISTDISLNDQAVITRQIDLQASPGMAAIIAAGQWYPLAFNGQFTEPGQTACIGTSSFGMTVGEELLNTINDRYLSQSQWLLQAILRHFLAGRTDIYAMLNIDLMLPSALERELWERAPHRYRDNVGCCNDSFAPRPYAPEQALVAEINPRDTNWTLAMKAVLQAKGLPFTVANIQMIAAGRDIQVAARDHWHLPRPFEQPELREKLFTFHQNLAKRGEGFILRMADDPAGVIIYTESPDLNRLNQISDEAYAFLRGM